MNGGEWRKAAKEEEMQEGAPISVKLGEEEILLVMIDGEIYACGNKCTHYGAPLAEGVLAGRTVICPGHFARFDVTTGSMEAPPALSDVGCYKVKIEDGEVYVSEKHPTVHRPTPHGMERTFAIIGAGAAGNAAAETLRREGFTGRIVMVTREKRLPYDRPSLSKGVISGRDDLAAIGLRRQAFYDRHKMEVLTGRQIVSINMANQALHFADGAQIKADRVLLATGGRPRRLDVPGSDLAGCFVLRSATDAEAILGALGNAQSMAVVGASFIGMEVAAALAQRKLPVHVIAPEAVPMMGVFGERVGRRFQRIHEENGVRFHLKAKPAALKGDKRVREVVLADGSTVPADMVIVGIGIEPVVDYLKGTGLEENGVVPVNECLQTKAAGVFAAGDIALVPHAKGAARRIEHWVVAERQGQHAARAMLGAEKPYDELPFFWTRQLGNSVKYVGYAPKFDNIAYRGDVDGGDFLAGYYQDDELRAVAASGMFRELVALSNVIHSGAGMFFEDFEDEDLDLMEVL